VPRCVVCGGRVSKGIEICSTACKREHKKLTRIQAERRAKRKRFDHTRGLYCTICDKKLRAPGRFCKEHRYLYMREYRARRKNNVRSTTIT